MTISIYSAVSEVGPDSSSTRIAVCGETKEGLGTAGRTVRQAETIKQAVAEIAMRTILSFLVDITAQDAAKACPLSVLALLADVAIFISIAISIVS